MAYVKTTWQNSPSTNTPINATNLNHIEQGIYEAAATADQAESGVEALDPRMDLVEQRLDNLIPEGTPTQGNAELIDIRVGANGVTYPDAGSAVRGQYTELKSALTRNHDSIDYFGYYGTFVNGGLNLGIVNSDYLNRVTSDTLFEFDRPITIKPKTGFRFLYCPYVNGSYSNKGFYTDARTIGAGTQFKILIARVNENPTTYVENIDEFLDAIVFDTDMEYRMDSAETNIDSFDVTVSRNIENYVIKTGVYLNNQGEEVASGIDDTVYYIDVAEGKSVTCSGITNYSVRFACGYYQGEFVKYFTQSANNTQTFDTTGIDKIGVCKLPAADKIVATYDDFSEVTSYGLSYIDSHNKEKDGTGNYLPSVISLGNPASWDSGYIKANGTVIEASASYRHSDYIAVYGSAEIMATLIYPAEGKGVHFYDANKNVIGSLSKSGSTQDITFTTPFNTRFIRVTITNTPANFPKTRFTYTASIDRQYITNHLVHGWYAQSHDSMETLFKKATSQPILTLIDDDTPTVASCTLYRNSCVANGVVGCFAVITQQLASQSGLADLLKSYEKEGFQNLFHCHSQIKAYDTSSAQYNIVTAEADMVQGIQEIITYGFANWRYWCTPYGSFNADLASLARKWGLKCLIRSGMADYETIPPHPMGKYQISRCSLNQDDTALQVVKNAIDSAYLDNGWVLVTTHMSEVGWDSPESQERFAEVIAYAKSKGFAIRTVADALEIRNPIYGFFETF